MTTNKYCGICAADDHIGTNCPYNASDNDELYDQFYDMEGGYGHRPFNIAKVWTSVRSAYNKIISEGDAMLTSLTDTGSTPAEQAEAANPTNTNITKILNYVYEKLNTEENRKNFIDNLVQRGHLDASRQSDPPVEIVNARSHMPTFVKLIMDISFTEDEAETVSKIIKGEAEEVYKEWRVAAAEEEEVQWLRREGETLADYQTRIEQRRDGEGDAEYQARQEQAADKKKRVRARWKKATKRVIDQQRLRVWRLIIHFARATNECAKDVMEAQGSVNFINPMEHKFNDHLEQCNNIESAKGIVISTLAGLSGDQVEKLLSNFRMSSFERGEGVTTIDVASFSSVWGDLCKDAKETSSHAWRHSKLVALEHFLGFFFTSGWGGSSIHTGTAALVNPHSVGGQGLNSPSGWSYGAWSASYEGERWWENHSSLKSNVEKGLITKFNLESINIKHTSPIFNELRQIQGMNRTAQHIQFGQNIIGMAVILGITGGLWVLVAPLIPGLITPASELAAKTWSLTTSLLAIAYTSIAKTVGFLGGLIGAAASAQWRQRMGKQRFVRNMVWSWSRLKKALLLHGINSWIDKEFIRDIYYSKMSLFNTLQKQITMSNVNSNIKMASGLSSHTEASSPNGQATIQNTECDDNMYNYINNLINKQILSTNTPMYIPEMHDIQSNMYNSLLCYNTPHTLNNIFKEDFMSSIFNSLIFKQNIGDDEINAVANAENLLELIDSQMAINISRSLDIKKVKDIQDSNNNLLKKLYVCIYTDVQKYYISKLNVTSPPTPSEADVGPAIATPGANSDKTVNHALKYIFNDSIREISANITLRIYNGHIAHVIYMLIQDPKLVLDPSTNQMKSIPPGVNHVIKINKEKLKHFIKMFKKYIAIRLIQEHPGTRSGKVMNILYNKQGSDMKAKINTLIANNERIYLPKVSPPTDAIKHEYFSCENIIDTASYNGEPYENNDDLADWFTSCIDKNNNNKKIYNYTWPTSGEEEREAGEEENDEIENQCFILKDEDVLRVTLHDKQKVEQVVCTVKINDAYELDSQFRLNSFDQDGKYPYLHGEIARVSLSSLSRKGMNNRYPTYASDDNMLLQLHNVLDNFKADATFNLSKTKFVERLAAYFEMRRNKEGGHGEDQLKEFFYRSPTKLEGSTTIKIYHFKNHLFDSVPNLLSIIDYKIPVALFTPEPNYYVNRFPYSRGYREGTAQAAPLGYFSRNQLHNRFFNYTEHDCTTVSINCWEDLSPIKSINKENVICAPGPEQKAHDRYYHFNDMYRYVLETYILYQQSNTSSAANMAFNIFKSNLKYNECLNFSFDYDIIKWDSYSACWADIESPARPAAEVGPDTKNIIENVRGMIQEEETAAALAVSASVSASVAEAEAEALDALDNTSTPESTARGENNIYGDTWPDKIRDNYFKQENFITIMLEQGKKQGVVACESADAKSNTYISGIYGNGIDLVNNNIVPTINFKDNKYEMNLDDNIWIYYDINEDQICMRFKGDISEDNKDTLHISEKSSLNFKITNEDIKALTDKFIESENKDKVTTVHFKYDDIEISEALFSSVNAAAAVVPSSGTVGGEQAGLVQRQRVSNIYLQHLFYKQYHLEQNIQTDRFMMKHSFNRIRLIDVGIDKSELDKDIKFAKLKEYLTVDEILNLEWEIAYNIEDFIKYSDKANNGCNLNMTHTIKPILKDNSNLAESIVDLAHQIDTAASIYKTDKNHLESQFIDLSFKTNDGGEKLWKKKLIEYLIKDLRPIVPEFFMLPGEYSGDYMGRGDSYLPHVSTGSYKAYVIPYIEHIKLKKKDSFRNYEIVINFQLLIKHNHALLGVVDEYVTTLDKWQNPYGDAVPTGRTGGRQQAPARSLSTYNKLSLIQEKIKNKEFLKWVKTKDSGLLEWKKNFEGWLKFEDPPRMPKISCGITSILGDICHRIYSYYIEGYIDKLSIKSFVQTGDDKLMLTRYMKSFKPYRNRMKGVCPVDDDLPELNLSGHSIGGSYASGLLYIMYHKLCKYARKAGEEEREAGEEAPVAKLTEMDTLFNELKKILYKTTAYSYGSSRHFDSYASVFENYITKLLHDHYEAEELVKANTDTDHTDTDHTKSPANIINILNIGAPLPLISWNNIHIGKTIYMGDNIWNNLGYKVFNVENWVNDSCRSSEAGTADRDAAAESGGRAPQKNSTIQIYDWLRGMEYNDSAGTHCYHDKYHFPDEYKSTRFIVSKSRSDNIEENNYGFILERDKTYIRGMHGHNHVAVNPVIQRDRNLSEEYIRIDDPNILNIIELQLANTTSGYMTYGGSKIKKAAATDKTALRNRTFEDIYSWINNKVGLENHHMNRCWIREVQGLGDKKIYKNAALSYGEDYSTVPWMMNMPHVYLRNIRCLGYKLKYEPFLKEYLGKDLKAPREPPCDWHTFTTKLDIPVNHINKKSSGFTNLKEFIGVLYSKPSIIKLSDVKIEQHGAGKINKASIKFLHLPINEEDAEEEYTLSLDLSDIVDPEIGPRKIKIICHVLEIIKIIQNNTDKILCQGTNAKKYISRCYNNNIIKEKSNELIKDILEGILNIRTLDKKYSKIIRLEKAFEANRLAKLLFITHDKKLTTYEALNYFAKYYEDDLERIKTNEFLINKINNSKLDFDGNYKYFHIIKFNDRIHKFFSFEDVPIIGFISETEVPSAVAPDLRDPGSITVENSYINKKLWMLGTYHNLNTPYRGKDSNEVLAKGWPLLQHNLYNREIPNATDAPHIDKSNLDSMLTYSNRVVSLLNDIRQPDNPWQWPAGGIKSTILKPYKCWTGDPACGIIRLNKKNLVIVWESTGFSDEIPLDSIVICNYINPNKEVDYNSFCFKYDNTEYVFSFPREYNTESAQLNITHLKLESELSKAPAAAAAAVDAVGPVSGGGTETDDSDNESSLLKIRPYRSETDSSEHSDWSSEWSDSEED